jgi:hypothetical protein
LQGKIRLWETFRAKAARRISFNCHVFNRLYASIREWPGVTFRLLRHPAELAPEDFMATRITVVKNPNGQFQGWMCKHSRHAVHNAECDGHVVLCERCASAVRNGAELLSDGNGEQVEPVKITAVPVVKRAAAAAGAH